MATNSTVMKKVFLTLFSFISFICYAQDDLNYTPEKKVGDIPKKANTIIIADSLPKMELYAKISDLLFENGYGILSSDKELGNITTTEKSFKNGVVKLTFLIKDNRILMRGHYRDDFTLDLGGVSSGPEWAEIKYYGMKKSITMNAWDEMSKFANAIPGKKEYLMK
jgi:hypothetical protein